MVWEWKINFHGISVKNAPVVTFQELVDVFSLFSLTASFSCRPEKFRVEEIE